MASGGEPTPPSHVELVGRFGGGVCGEVGRGGEGGGGGLEGGGGGGLEGGGRVVGESVNRRWSLVLTLCKCPLGSPFWLKWALPFFLGI